MAVCAESTVIRILWLGFQLFARLFFVRFYGIVPTLSGSPRWDRLRVSER
jgi:hypothetical protein